MLCCVVYDDDVKSITTLLFCFYSNFIYMSGMLLYSNIVTCYVSEQVHRLESLAEPPFLHRV